LPDDCQNGQKHVAKTEYKDAVLTEKPEPHFDTQHDAYDKKKAYIVLGHIRLFLLMPYNSLNRKIFIFKMFLILLLRFSIVPSFFEF
jgi:hypothetical protein